MRLDQRVAPDTAPVEHAPSPQPRPRSRRRVHVAVAAAVILAVVLGTVGTFRFSDALSRSVQAVTADQSRSASDRVVLDDLWAAYKQTYLEQGTHRTIDRQSNELTTSEGESYTLLRSVWTDDLQTFTDSWQWTKDNLQRDDFLLSWRFGPLGDGTYGVQEDAGGRNSASDADVDTAFALLMAYSRWKQDVFLYDALPLIQSIWEREVVSVGGAPVLVADNLERDNPIRLLINPSYFAPYAYRVFAKVDPQHDWLGLVDNSYTILQQLDQQPLDADRSAGLPPDWVSLNRFNGQFSLPSGALTTHFGYDALRSPWRLALDYRWYGEERARQLLKRKAVLAQQWTAGHRLVAAYGRNGMPAADYESPAMYGGAMGYFTVVQPALADQVFDEKLLPLHDADTEDLARPLGYYDSNWVWFGMALYLDELPNLTVSHE